MKDNIIEFRRGNWDTTPAPTYNPGNRLLELWGIGTGISFASGVAMMLGFHLQTHNHPEALYGVVAGAVLVTASVPGILYFTREVLSDLNTLVHH
jgi:hypothetical protein